MPPLKPSQTFSRDPVLTGWDKGAFAALAGRNGTSAAFSLVKMPIEHNGDYARRFLGRSCSVLRSPRPSAGVACGTMRGSIHRAVGYLLSTAAQPLNRNVKQSTRINSWDHYRFGSCS